MANKALQRQEDHSGQADFRANRGVDRHCRCEFRQLVEWHGRGKQHTTLLCEATFFHSNWRGCIQGNLRGTQGNKCCSTWSGKDVVVEGCEYTFLFYLFRRVFVGRNWRNFSLDLGTWVEGIFSSWINCSGKIRMNFWETFYCSTPCKMSSRRLNKRINGTRSELQRKSRRLAELCPRSWESRNTTKSCLMSSTKLIVLWIWDL